MRSRFTCAIRRHLRLFIAASVLQLPWTLSLAPAAPAQAQTSPDPNPSPTRDVIIGVRKDAKIGDIQRHYRTQLLLEVAPKSVYRLRVTLENPSDPTEFPRLLTRMGLDSRRHILYAVEAPASEFSGSSVPFDNYIWGNLQPGDLSAQPAMGRVGLGITQPRPATGEGVMVAVIDSGFVPSHPYLKDSWTSRAQRWDYLDGDDNPEDKRDGRDDDGDGQVDESFGHGTFVAGIVHTLAMDARIAPYRVVDSEGRVSDVLVADAIGRALAAGARVINLSLALPGTSPVLSAAIQRATAAGALVVGSAGNNGSGSPWYPAADPCALSVTAIDEAGMLAPFANYGPEVDLALPGVNVLSSFPKTRVQTAEGDRDYLYASWSGTSVAAPFVSGQAALLLSMDPTLGPAEVAALIAATAAPVDAVNPQRAGLLGWGLPNVSASFALLQAGTPLSPITDPLAECTALSRALHRWQPYR